MRKYDRYKPSHIAWMGAVPETWQIQRIKTVLESEQNGTWGDDVKGDGNDVYCIRVADFNKSFDQLDRYDNTIRNVPHRDFQVRQLKVGDLLIEKSGGGETSPVGRVGIYNWSDRKAVTSNFMARLRPKATRVISKFLFYVFKSMYSIGVNSKSIKQTTGIQNMDTYSYFNECIALPPLEEQTAIANYLDEKTAQIDTLIEKKQKLIELLNEERKAIINEAVSDEGKNWERKKLKYIGDVIGGAAFSSSDFSTTGQVRVLKISNIQHDFVDWTDSEYVSEDVAKANLSCRVLNGDIVFALTRPIISSGIKSARAFFDPDEIVLLNQRNAILRLHQDIDSAFVYYVTHSKYFFDMFQLSIDNTGQQPNISPVSIKNFEILLPAVDVQRKVAKEIKGELARVDKVIERVSAEIELINEYKTALISEVVTGKVKVV